MKSPEQLAEERYPYSMQRLLWSKTDKGRHENGVDLQRLAYATCIREEVEPLEARVERFRALVQRFVDHNAKWLGKGCLEADIQWDAIVGDCQEQGFVPTNTEDK